MTVITSGFTNYTTQEGLANLLLSEDIFYSSYSSRSSTSFTIDDFSGFQLVASGTGFTYNSVSFGGFTNYELIGGTFTNFKFLTSTGSTAFEISGFSLPTQQLEKYSLNNNYSSLLQYLFNGTDTLSGAAGNDLLYGHSGNDKLYGSAGDDELYGGSGADTLVGEAGADFLVGGSGQDFASYTSSTAGIKVSLEYGVNGVGGDAEGDELIGIERVDGSAFNDQLTGNSGNNTIYGGAGNDTLLGLSGNDALIGNVGNDQLTGGAGADNFSYYERASFGDIIADFETADQILVSRNVATGLVAGTLSNTQFTLGSAATTTSQRFIYNQSTGGLYFDVDGLGGTTQELLATLSTKPTFTAAEITVI